MDERDIEIVLIDLGPNLGAINRSVLVASDYLAVPLIPDLFSLQGLKNLGPSVRNWRKQWKARKEKNSFKNPDLPEGRMEPLGYVIMQHAEKLGSPVKAYERWAKKIPMVYAEEVLNLKTNSNTKADANQLGLIKHYRSLMPMAQEAHKPIFHLLPADGAIGSHQKAVFDARDNFKQLALEILDRCGITNPGLLNIKKRILISKIIARNNSNR